MKVCVASRPLLEIEIRIFKYPGFRVHEWTANDIGMYARDRLMMSATLLSAQFNSSQSHINWSLIENIVKNASGVFLWVKLVVDELVIGMEEGDYPSELQRRLDTLPPDLEDLYNRILDQISLKNLHDTINYFSLIFALKGYTQERYSFLKFTLAASCDPLKALQVPAQASVDRKGYIELCKQMIQRLKSRCRTLVQAIVPLDDVEESDISDDTTTAMGSQTPDVPIFKCSVRLIHRTVEEHLRKPEVDRALRSKVHHERLQNPHVALMAASVHLLKLAVPWPTWPLETIYSSISDSKNPFLRTTMLPAYNLLCCVMHEVWNAENSIGLAQEKYIDEMDRVLSKVHQKWGGLFHLRFQSELPIYSSRPDSEDELSEDGVDMLALAALAGLELYVKEKVKTEAFRSRQKCARSLLGCATDPTESPSQSLTRFLLRNGADPNEVWKGTSIWENAIDRWARSKRKWLYRRDYCFICILMLQFGAYANQLVTREDGFSTVLNLCILTFMRSEAEDEQSEEEDENTICRLIRTLLECGANPDAKDSNGVSARNIAMREDCNPIVMKMILEAEALSSVVPSEKTRSKASIEKGEEEASDTCAFARQSKLRDEDENV